MVELHDSAETGKQATRIKRTCMHIYCERKTLSERLIRQAKRAMLVLGPKLEVMISSLDYWSVQYVQGEEDKGYSGVNSSAVM